MMDKIGTDYNTHCAVRGAHRTAFKGNRVSSIADIDTDTDVFLTYRGSSCRGQQSAVIYEVNHSEHILMTIKSH